MSQDIPVKTKVVKSKQAYSNKILLEQASGSFTSNLLASNATQSADKDLCRKIVSQIAEKSLEELCGEIHPATLAGLQGESFNRNKAHSALESEGLRLSPSLKAALSRKATFCLEEVR